MRELLEAVQLAALRGHCELALDLATNELTMLNGSNDERDAAWIEIQLLTGKL